MYPLYIIDIWSFLIPFVLILYCWSNLPLAGLTDEGSDKVDDWLGHEPSMYLPS